MGMVERETQTDETRDGGRGVQTIAVAQARLVRLPARAVYRCDAMHEIDDERAQTICAAMLTRGWAGPPVLLVEVRPDEYRILDGHHRIKGLQLQNEDPDRERDIDDFPALIITQEDMDALVDAHFYGDAPCRLCDLDDYILVDGAPYALREDS